VQRQHLSLTAARQLAATTRLLGACAAGFCAAACQGTVSPDPSPPAGALGVTCFQIPASIGACSDIHFRRAALTCGGNGSPAVAVGGAPGGANRFTIQLFNGSRFQGTLITPDPACLITDGTDADFTFGVVYTGDQGVESNGSPCMVQSKMVYSSFNFDLVGLAPHEGLLKTRLHEIFDREIINQVFVTQGRPPLVGRCARWRQMP